MNFFEKYTFLNIHKFHLFLALSDAMFILFQNNPYKKVVIFVDNAGIDFVLGILPFARELLKLGTKVILVGNSLPALNDVTYRELKSYLVEASNQCDIFENALNEHRLESFENGQRGPCLDLASLPEGEYL